MEGPPHQPDQNNPSDDCVWVTGKPGRCEIASDGSIKTEVESDPNIWQLPAIIPGIGLDKKKDPVNSIKEHIEKEVEIVSPLTNDNGE